MATGLSDSDLSFYSTAAQVIPALYIALALEIAVPAKPSDLDPRVEVALVAIAVIMFVGEMIALAALLYDRTTDAGGTFVLVALGLGVVTVIFGALDRLQARR